MVPSSEAPATAAPPKKSTLTRTLLVLSGTLLVAGGILFSFYRTAFITEETGGLPIPVLIAAQDIPFGQPIRREWLTTRQLPQQYVEDRHLDVAEASNLIGLPLSQSVRAGEALLRTDLSNLSDQQRTLSGEIPSGERAVTVQTVPESSHAGLLRPGDRVDALLVIGDPREPNSGRAVLVCQDLTVLSIGRTLRASFDEERGNARRDWHSQVTLQVDPTEAQRLILAREQGRVRLLLRNHNDASALDDPPELRESELYEPRRRADWIRRFALVEQGSEESVQ